MARHRHYKHHKRAYHRRHRSNIPFLFLGIFLVVLLISGISFVSSTVSINPPTPTPTPTATPSPTPTGGGGGGGTPTPSPTPTPIGTYTYTMSVSNGNYKVVNTANAQIASGQSSSNVFNSIFGSNGVAQSGNTMYVSSGAYSVDSTWNINKASVTVTFASGLNVQYGAGTAGATLTANNGVGNNAMWISGNNVVVIGLTLDGNAAVNSVYFSNGKLQTGNNGVVVSSSNSVVEYSTIYDVGGWAVLTYGSGAVNSGFSQCKIYNIGANGFSDVDPSNNGSNAPNHCFCINSEVYACADVGIDVYGGHNTIITGNYVHDINHLNTPLAGFQNSYNGIDVELGGGIGSGNYATIANNTLLNVNEDDAIILCSSDTQNINYVLISGNTCTNCWIGVGIHNNLGAANNKIEYNIFINCVSKGIILDGSCSNTVVYGNSFTNCGINFQNGGSGTITSGP